MKGVRTVIKIAAYSKPLVEGRGVMAAIFKGK
jgi:hypothetical protein